VDRTKLRGLVAAVAATITVTAVAVGLTVSVGEPTAQAETKTWVPAPTTAAAVFSTSPSAARWERAYLAEARMERLDRERVERERVAKERAARAAREKAARVKAARVKAARVKAARVKAARVKAARKAARVKAARARARKATAVRSGGSPKAIARQMLAARGWGGGQFSCLDQLWTRESGWRVTADNPSSSAYGIPQALPGSKMSSAGPNWRTDAATQIRWGLGYIASRHGSPCGAWSHSQSRGWY
jgi:hypothetical protein